LPPSIASSGDDTLVEVGDRVVSLERFTEVCAFRQFALEERLASAARVGDRTEVRTLEARQRLLPFETLEWLVDALLLEAAACSLGLDDSAEGATRFGEVKIGAMRHLVSGEPLADRFGGPRVALEEVRLQLCMRPSAFTEILRWNHLREQVGAERDGPGAKSCAVLLLEQRLAGLGLPPHPASDGVETSPTWLAERRETTHVARHLDSSAYEWMIDRLLPVRDAWWSSAHHVNPRGEAA
jgi:hypothetical protein